MTGRPAPNPFVAGGVASRYLDGRPASQEAALRRAGAMAGIERVHRGLDVACGPGPSTRALAQMADVVIGADVAEEMVRTAAEVGDTQCLYLAAAAEALPFPDSCFDIVTVGSAVHWFDQDRFCSEALRVLAAERWLVVYEHHFLGAAHESEMLETWVRDRYLDRYPIPPRGEHPGPRWEANGFDKIGRDEYGDGVPMTRPQLVNYLMTQSNTVVPIDRGATTAAEVEQWLEQELEPFFGDAERLTLEFWGVVNVFRSS